MAENARQEKYLVSQHLFLPLPQFKFIKFIIPLLLSDHSFLKTLLATRKNAKELKMLVHYDVPQLIAMMIRYPILIKSKFKKGFIKIFIFPYSNINFLRLELKISNSMKISLHVGRRPSWTDDQ